MNISNFHFSIQHGDDGAAVLSLHHGGDVLHMELTPDQRRALGLNLLDPTTAAEAPGEQADA
ncbi:hypothetical protein [Magnetovibrio sp.]|uniref:hypothetical protein n=1 Tax=Magnetovibrio sp. TaxID=2024836 RepID=UPI002F948FA4